MFCPLWLRPLVRLLWRCPPTRKSPTPRRLHRVRLALEGLDDRIMPSVTVTTTLDPATPIAGQLSLREAINMVNAGQVADNTIILPAGNYQNTQGALNVTHSLNLQGAGSGSTILDGGGTDRVVLIDPTTAVNVQISGATIRDGNTSGAGGGIDVQDQSGQSSTLTVMNSLITTNTAGNADFGGGGIAANNGNINVINSQVTDNLSRAFGGGIADNNQGTGNVTVTTSLIADNTAGSAGGGIAVSSGGPGALTVTGSTVSSNSAVLSGGGIFAETIGAVRITNTTLEGNTSLGDGGGFAEQLAGPTNIVFSNDTIDDNQSMQGNGQSMQGNGGGIAVETASNVSLQNSTLSGNTAGQAGGGVFLGNTVLTATLQDSTVSGNTSGTSGGGVEDDVATLTATNSLFDNNKTINGNGGAIDLASAAGQAATLTNVTFRFNNAAGSFPAGTGDGGAVSVISDSTLTIVRCLFVGNKTTVEGGGVSQFQGSLSVRDSQFTGNISITTTGGGISFHGSAGYTIAGTTFNNNQASVAGGLGVSSNGTGASGLLVNDTFTGNTAIQAAGLLLSGTQPVTLLNDTINGNSASQGTGGVVISNPAIFQNTIVAGNNAAGAFSPDILLSVGPLTDNGGNLIGNATGVTSFTSPTDLLGVNPLLGPLQNNGGPLAGANSDQQVVQTEALLPGSPAIAKGVANGAPTTDERGFPRLTPPDIGAFQFQDVPLTVAVAPATPTVRLNGTDTFTVTVSNTGATALPADNSRLNLTLSAGLIVPMPLTFTLAAIPAGQSQTFTVTATATTLGTQTLTATVTSVDTNSIRCHGHGDRQCSNDDRTTDDDAHAHRHADAVRLRFWADGHRSVRGR